MSRNPKPTRCAILFPLGILCNPIVPPENGVPPTALSPMESLPPPVLHRILHSLPYLSRIRLAVTSWTLRASVADPSAHGSLLDKVCFVRDRLSFLLESQRWWNPRICHGCWRVRDLSKFSANQLSYPEEMGWRRRCRNCLWRFYGPDRDAEAAGRWARLERCIVCLELKEEGEGCEGCVVFEKRMAEERLRNALEMRWRRARERKRAWRRGDFFELDDVDAGDTVGASRGWMWVDEDGEADGVDDDEGDSLVPWMRTVGWSQQADPLVDGEVAFTAEEADIGYEV
ncbi:hypothetical protein QBC47DRAFT_429488 [Echria macrotheca]|uniref:F-box domain-containing protein n=1 Tax=Echria macrotheca TaxID=438768 RepID=A0AAJ0BBI5_9PEZI|nr:hypothetical protein QBC47DRAFT_429488 [Echria macrotheca]